MLTLEGKLDVCKILIKIRRQAKEVALGEQNDEKKQKVAYAFHGGRQIWIGQLSQKSKEELAILGAQRGHGGGGRGRKL